MKSIDEARLETDLNYRYEYLCEFIGFTPDDVSAIHAAAGHLAPLVPQLVEKTYDRLLSFDATARHFLPRQHGYSGPLPANLAELSQTHAQIKFRKEHLMRYLMHILGHAYNAKMVQYLDVAGKIHTPLAGNKEIVVPLVQMNALLGLLGDMLTGAILELDLDAAEKAKTLRAFGKLLWIQNDLVNRHYCIAGNGPDGFEPRTSGVPQAAVV